MDKTENNEEVVEDDEEFVRRVGSLAGRLLSLFTLVDELMDIDKPATEILEIVEKGVEAIEERLMG